METTEKQITRTCIRIVKTLKINGKPCKFVVILVVTSMIFFLHTGSNLSKWNNYFKGNINEIEEYRIHNFKIEKYFERRKKWNTSNLGSILFKNANPAEFNRSYIENKTYIVLIWKHWNWLKNRHLYYFGGQKETKKLLEDCSVKNCIFSGDHKYMESADAVVIHMMNKVMPRVLPRDPKQRWIFLSDESTINTFCYGGGSNLTLRDMNLAFNWTMTYRADSDVPVPYGRTVPLTKPIITSNLSGAKDILSKLVPYWDKKIYSNRTMVLTSHCIGKRLKFVHELRKHLDVEIFGKCSDKKENREKCPGHFRSDCLVPTSYLFYLVQENSKCYQYITEKIYQHAYSKGVIPVIMGVSLEDCRDLLPPNSFLHVDDYPNVQELAEHMTQISEDFERILFYHAWRKHFAVLNEHGYFQTKSYHFCRVCEALNYNTNEIKSYSESDLKMFLSEKLCDLKYLS